MARRISLKENPAEKLGTRNHNNSKNKNINNSKIIAHCTTITTTTAVAIAATAVTSIPLTTVEISKISVVRTIAKTASTLTTLTMHNGSKNESAERKPMSNSSSSRHGTSDRPSLVLVAYNAALDLLTILFDALVLSNAVNPSLAEKESLPEAKEMESACRIEQGKEGTSCIYILQSDNYNQRDHHFRPHLLHPVRLPWLRTAPEPGPLPIHRAAAEVRRPGRPEAGRGARPRIHHRRRRPGHLVLALRSAAVGQG